MKVLQTISLFLLCIAFSLKKSVSGFRAVAISTRQTTTTRKTFTFRMTGSDKTAMNYPELIVFDLDACLWDQEMYAMPALPSKKVYGDLNGKGEGGKYQYHIRFTYGVWLYPQAILLISQKDNRIILLLSTF